MPALEARAASKGRSLGAAALEAAALAAAPTGDSAAGDAVATEVEVVEHAVGYQGSSRAPTIVQTGIHYHTW